MKYVPRGRRKRTYWTNFKLGIYAIGLFLILYPLALISIPILLCWLIIWLLYKFITNV